MSTPYRTPDPAPRQAPAHDPDAIRADIARTRHELSGDVDALAGKVTPGRVVERRVDRVRGRLAGWRDAVMGSDPGPGTAGRARSAAGTARSLAEQASDRVDDAAATASHTASDAASAVADTARDTPRVARHQTRGNPLAAGLIAFGAGWLASSLLPASRREQALAAQTENAALDAGRPLARKAGQTAEELADDLRGPAARAARSVRDTAQRAASTVQEEGRSAAGQVQDRAQDAGRNVQDEARDG